MKIKNVFDEVFSMENLQGALEDAIRGRRYEREPLLYALNSYERLKGIQEEIYSGKYSIDKYYIFYVYEPKKRMIMSISFKHRIVQWAIYRVINPIFVKSYIEDSYGCVPGRGSLGAMKRLKSWLDHAHRKGGDWYYLKLDISKYFYRISHRILKEILAKKIKDDRLLAVIFSIIDCEHTPFGLPPGKGPGEVPISERLYDVGMPIGNLLSQVFANLYLDQLDQYCKRDLRIRHYIRYMDDVIILFPDKKQLHAWKNQIEIFLKEELELDLNKKTCIRPVTQGIEFVGYRVWWDHATLRKSTALRIKRAVKGIMKKYSEGRITAEEAFCTVTCYVGMMEQCDCQALEEKVLSEFVLRRDHGGGGQHDGGDPAGGGGTGRHHHAEGNDDLPAGPAADRAGDGERRDRRSHTGNSGGAGAECGGILWREE